MFSFREILPAGAIRLTDGLGSPFAGTPGAYLGADHPAAVDDLARLRAHGGITAVLAASSNATRLRGRERIRDPIGSVNWRSLFDDDEPKGVRDLFKVARDTIGNLQPLPAIFRLANALDGVAGKAAIDRKS